MAKLHLAQEILNMMWPVGSIYISIDSTNPNTKFGGTWSQIKGRFLLGTGSLENNNNTYFGQVTAGQVNVPAGEKGGEAYHKLSINEMPSHNHKGNHWWLTTTDNFENSWKGGSSWTDGNNTITNLGNNNTSNKYSENVGGEKAHNNIPPYYAVYIWQRTA